MPVDYKLYPKNWKTWIRPQVLKRAGHHCEWCGLKNGTRGWRDEAGTFHPVDLTNKNHVGKKIFRIVLTVAHLDHDLKNNDLMDMGHFALPLHEANLVALCQKCHNSHDAKYRAQNRKAKQPKPQPQLKQPELF